MIWYNYILPFPGFVAMNLCGLICFRKTYKGYGERHPEWFAKVINHENIHTLQIKELWYIGFYLLYAGEWIYNLFIYKNADKAYRNIRFEKEAYRNENNLNYLSERTKFAWKQYGKEDTNT